LKSQIEKPKETRNREHKFHSIDSIQIQRDSAILNLWEYKINKLIVEAYLEQECVSTQKRQHIKSILESFR